MGQDKKKSISISGITYQQIKREAEKRGVSISQLIDDLISNKLNEIEIKNNTLVASQAYLSEATAQK